MIFILSNPVINSIKDTVHPPFKVNIVQYQIKWNTSFHFNYSIINGIKNPIKPPKTPTIAVIPIEANLLFLSIVSSISSFSSNYSILFSFLFSS